MFRAVNGVCGLLPQITIALGRTLLVRGTTAHIIVGLSDEWTVIVKIIFLRVCCFLTGSLVSFTAAVFRSYRAPTLFVAVDHTPIQNLLFQRDARPIRDFYLAGIRLELLRVHPGFHLYVYRISRDNCRSVTDIRHSNFRTMWPLLQFGLC
jgi:hypothetical protein